MDVKITDLEELGNILRRLYWIESQYENSAEWEAYLTINEDKRDLIYKLIYDSEKHKIEVERIANNLGINLREKIDDSEGDSFNFSKITDDEIFNKILKFEEIMKELYLRILNNTDRELVESKWKDKNPEFFFDKLKWLVSQEEKHINMIKPKACNLMRVCK